MSKWLPWVLAVVGFASAGWLALDNGRLRERTVVAETTVKELRVEVEAARAGGGGELRGARANPMAVLNAFGRAMDRGTGQEPEARQEPPRDWEQRRADRQQRMRDLLGRQEGESAEAYKARVAPLVTTVLSRPRERMSEKRRQFEEAAGITPEQRAKLDEAFQAAQAELVGLANVSVAAGDLTPYKRNTSGILAFVGSTVGTVDTVEQRLGSILSSEQRQIMDEAGFDWLEYLGVSTPWEQMDAPPAAPGTGG